MTYLVPLTNAMLLAFLEHALVVRDTVFAVDEAVAEEQLAIVRFVVKWAHPQYRAQRRPEELERLAKRV